MVDLINSLLEYDPSERITARSMLGRHSHIPQRHAFFDDFNTDLTRSLKARRSMRRGLNLKLQLSQLLREVAVLTVIYSSNANALRVRNNKELKQSKLRDKR